MKVRAGTLSVEGIETHYLRAGSGEPVVLLHGLGASSYSWRFAFPALADRFDVIAPDLPGFGRSGKPWDHDYSIAGQHRWVMSFLDGLGVKKARFVGNSMGGVISLWAALETPERVERLGLLGTPAYPENRPKLLWPLSWPVIGSFYERLLGDTTLRWIAWGTFVDKSKVTEELIAEYGHALKSPNGRRAVAQFIRTALPPDWRERVESYARIPHRSLVLVGDSDSMVDRRGAERLAGHLPHARLVWMERCGHAPQEDAPDRVLPVLRDFLCEA